MSTVLPASISPDESVDTSGVKAISRTIFVEEDDPHSRMGSNIKYLKLI